MSDLDGLGSVSSHAGPSNGNGAAQKAVKRTRQTRESTFMHGHQARYADNKQKVAMVSNRIRDKAPS